MEFIRVVLFVVALLVGETLSVLGVVFAIRGIRMKVSKQAPKVILMILSILIGLICAAGIIWFTFLIVISGVESYNNWIKDWISK